MVARDKDGKRSAGAMLRLLGRWSSLAPSPAGWLQIIGFLWDVSAPLTLAVAVCALALAVLPLGETLTMGLLVGTVPHALWGGLVSPAGQRALGLFVALTGLFLADRTLSPIQSALAATLGRRLDQQLDERVMRAVNAFVGIEHLEDPRLQDRISLAQSVGVGLNTPGNAVIALVNKIPLWLQSAGYAVLLVGFHWWMGIGLLAIQIVAADIQRREYVQTVKIGTAKSRVLRRADYLRDLALTPGPAKDLRVYGLVDWIVDRYHQCWLEAIMPVWHASAQGDVRVRYATGGLALAQAIALGSLGWAGVMHLISLTAFTVYLQAVFGVGRLASTGTDDFRLAWGTAGVPALLELEQLAHAAICRDSDSTNTSSLREPLEGVGRRRGISFEGVSFRYPGTASDTLTDLDLCIPAGTSVAIVGANGAGKTTLVKLLCRLYEPTSGRITADGIDVQQQDARIWRRRVAAIFQDFVQYHLPARDNVAFGAITQAGQAELLAEAARRAGALGMIDALPHGWQTILSRQYARGTELSGGQWQRIALARALFAVSGGADVLILDEPTAHLDVRAEAELYDRFLEITAGLTTILISHRFSTVRRAGCICVLAQGRVVEQGTHDELLAYGGHYAHMFRLQASRFAQESGDE